MFVGGCIFAVIYLILYPGLGTWPGLLGTNSRIEVKQDQEAQDAAVAPIYAKYAKMSIPEVAADPAARVIGQRLFLNNCAQCHGSDAKGAPSFPNLTEGDSIYGRDPEAIIATITAGRNGIMPPFKGAIDAKTAGDIAQYVRSLSGLAADQIRIVNGKREYMNTCAACHGPEGKGNKALGAPNLTDDVWLYGSSEATIVDGIMNGRNNRMPAQAGVLTPEQIRLVAAFVWSLSGGKDVTSSVLNTAAPK
jgi:cytochrome c oxidase cbb3-type subunit 3